MSDQLESRASHERVYCPLGPDGCRVVRLVTQESALLNSREKAPFLVIMEVVSAQEDVDSGMRRASVATSRPVEGSAQLVSLPTPDVCIRLQLSVVGDSYVHVVIDAVITDLSPPRSASHSRVPSDIALACVAAAVAKQQPRPGPFPASASGGTLCEPWADKAARIRANSPYGHVPGWVLRPVIVKSGDDCRQELMAVQLVAMFQHIFSETGLPLWVRPFEVRVVLYCWRQWFLLYLM